VNDPATFAQMPRGFLSRNKQAAHIDRSALVQPDFVGALGDFCAQIPGLRRSGGAVRFLSRSVFHCSVPFYCPVTSTILKRASFRIIRP
jgi:hypothetical protein